MFSRIPFDKVNWITSSFLIGTLFLTLTAVPAYLWFFGLDWFQIALFFVMFCACGFSITLGYHRLFSHLAFQAHWSVRLFTAIFGAGAFENSIYLWACEHRAHHKHVDHDDDPYSITKGLFHAHIGWLLFKLNPEPPFTNVADLKKDPIVMWQHRYIHYIGTFIAFVFPAIIGYLWGGWESALGAFLIAGVARVVILQHCTFCINSLCHYIGSRPYSSRCSARDSWIMALVTFGEGYHNYHHEFQHDYRNGVKPWQFDPTKWIIWTLAKLGLARKLRRVPSDKIVLSELAETQRRIESKLNTPGLPETAHAYLSSAYEQLQHAAQEWTRMKEEKIEITREMLQELRNEIRRASAALREFHLVGLPTGA
ncbi:MAG TPA: fatty acid desaturase [Chthoniobacteraceae bacterium]|nr:fatty acid desaturase [Chthoniobacteraceae bacterium]